MLLRHRSSLHGLFFSNAVCPIMGSNYFLHFKTTPSSLNNKSNIHKFISSGLPSNSVPKLVSLSLKPSDLSFCSHASISRPVSKVCLEKPDEEIVDSQQLKLLRLKLEGIGIACGSCTPGQTYGLLCPMCKGGESGEKKLSLFVAEDGNAAVWTCFRAKCGWKGSTRAFADVKSSYNTMRKLPRVKRIKEIAEKDLKLEPLCHDLLEYFSERMISEETLRRNSESDTEKILYGLDDIEGESDIIIVEGEMDKLAMEEAGFRNCVSVPDGAPSKVSSKELPSHEQDTKYQYLWNCKEYLEKASRIILATDGDQPGQALAEELARRLGRERCWRVTWPSKNETEHFKDANEKLFCQVLMFMGPAVLREVIQTAELYPIKGLFNFRDYFSEIDAYYHQTLGSELGISTGWKAMDDLYNVVPGELTVVTGVPNSGKSEWIDALLCNLNESVGWKFALCSMENKVREHARKLLEKRLKKPFFDVRYGKSVERMSPEDLEAGKQWLSDTFHLIRCENDCLPSITWVLDLAKAAVLRHGVNGLMLTSVKRFAQHHSCHVWFVAHPKQLQQWTGKPPNLYDISGSAHFINKCDNGIIIHRNRDPEAGAMDLVQICVRKVRNKVSGTIGDAFLTYNRVTGEYLDIKPKDLKIISTLPTSLLKTPRTERTHITNFNT
ncbi:DNA helicase, DnaB-like, C-terminal [Cynara cardunculus var. scolymus]|uniref:DNA helicase, DnaB-like, C-terminal n=1 Tax=Cynara cardunculus var. scolymus TaxID=59895 RepID=A0A103Y194_CYNCS|nr:DNA helicase, DnaB-like, C-terminal [Cynara cardunculus var. scolymus]